MTTKPNVWLHSTIINKLFWTILHLQHKIHVIATDGNDVEKESAQSIIISSGERFDILVEANGDPRKNYFIRAETIEVKTRKNVRYIL